MTNFNTDPIVKNDRIDIISAFKTAQSDLNIAKNKIVDSMDILRTIKQNNLSDYLDNLANDIIRVMQEIDLRKFEIEDQN